jgi:anion-transporting  ArsA/GET3 family ATPase
MASFLDGRFIKVFMAPARAGGRAYLKVFSAGVTAVAGALTKVLGSQLLADASTFVNAMDTVFGGFRERAERTYALLQQPGTSFLVVAAPEPDALREAAYFVERLEQDAMPLSGLVLNRVHETAAPGLSAEHAVAAAEELAGDKAHTLTVGLLRVHADRMQRIARERHLVERFTAVFPKVPVATVRAQASDVHDLHGLRLVGVDLAGAR